LHPRITSKLFPLGIPDKPLTAVSTILAPFCPNCTTLQLNTSLVQLTLTAGTPLSVRIRLVHVTPELLRKCKIPKPELGTLKLKFSPVMEIHPPLGQPTGSRMMIPGSMLLALAPTAQRTSTAASTKTFFEVFTFKLL
jgi:hypothetical protein